MLIYTIIKTAIPILAFIFGYRFWGNSEKSNFFKSVVLFFGFLGTLIVFSLFEVIVVKPAREHYNSGVKNQIIHDINIGKYD